MKIEGQWVVTVDGVPYKFAIELVPATAPGPGPTPPPTPTPVPTGVVVDKLPHKMTPLDRPEKGKSYIDPAFGTKITRLTDAGPGGVIKPAYSTTQAWNADGGFMVLYSRVGGAHHELYNGKPPYNFIKNLAIAPVDIEQFYWHPTDPDILFYPSTDWALVKFHVSTGQKEVLYQFPKTGAYAYADSHAFMSWDAKHIGLKIKEGQMKGYVFHLDTATLSEAPFPDPDGAGPLQPNPDDHGPLMSATGDLVYWDGSVYNNQLVLLRKLDLSNAHEHACLARYADGRDTYNATSFDGTATNQNSVGALVVHEMANGQSRVLIGPTTGYPYTPSGTHVSAVAFKNPGWVALSSAGTGDGQVVLDNEIYLANTNPGSEIVMRLAHSRTTPKDKSKLGYWSEAHPTIHPAATHIIFASDWGNTGQVDTYVLEVPTVTP